MNRNAIAPIALLYRTSPTFSHAYGCYHSNLNGTNIRTLMYDKSMHVPFKFDSNLNGVRYGVTAECMYHSNLNGRNINDREGKRGMTDEGVIGHRR
jgi:hypothetical protein